jgi:hypothetical protein
MSETKIKIDIKDGYISFTEIDSSDKIVRYGCAVWMCTHSRTFRDCINEAFNQFNGVSDSI